MLVPPSTPDSGKAVSGGGSSLETDILKPMALNGSAPAFTDDRSNVTSDLSQVLSAQTGSEVEHAVKTTSRWFQYPVDTVAQKTHDGFTICSTADASGGETKPTERLTVHSSPADSTVLVPAKYTTRETLQKVVNKETLGMFDNTATNAFGVKNPKYHLVSVTQADLRKKIDKPVVQSDEGVSIGQMDWVFRLEEGSV